MLLEEAANLVPQFVLGRQVEQDQAMLRGEAVQKVMLIEQALGMFPVDGGGHPIVKDYRLGRWPSVLTSCAVKSHPSWIQLVVSGEWKMPFPVGTL